MLGFDISSTRLLTIARSRRHIEKYYGTAETGTFPTRVKPSNINTADVDLRGSFPAIREIEQRDGKTPSAPTLRCLNVRTRWRHDAKYSTRIRAPELFPSDDREESSDPINRVNLSKHESSVVSSLYN